MPSVPSIWSQDWLAANTQRRYPLRDDAGSQDTTASMRIPTDLLVEAVVPVAIGATVDVTKFHVAALSVSAAVVIVTLGYDGTPLGSIVVDRSTFVRYTTYFTSLATPFEDSLVAITLGSLDGLAGIAGAFEFTVAQAGLVPTVVRPNIRGVQALWVQNGSERLGPFRDDVTLMAGRNMQVLFQRRAGTSLDPHRITFNAVSGAGLNTPCDCDATAARPCIKTIDGIGPNDQGDFGLLGNECIEPVGVQNGLELEDNCAKPCCGDAELNKTRQDAERAQAQINGMANLMERLDSQLAAMQLAVTAAGG